MPTPGDSSDSRRDGIQVSLVNEQSRHPVDDAPLIEAVTAVLRDSDYASAAISLAVVDDATIHALNRQYLEHDWPTDVLSFVLDDDETHLEGEIVLSADTAASAAEDVRSSLAAEQLLYVIHGALHLIGYDDTTPETAEQMRAAESKYMKRFLPLLQGEGRGEGKQHPLPHGVQTR
jgi:probable rRNA maturation factor